MRPVNAILNNVSLRDLDARILVRTVSEPTPQEALTYSDSPGQDGQRLLERTRDTRRITVTFAVRELFDLAARSAIVDLVNGWARDGYLETSYRPGKRIRVTAAGWASIQDPRNYNEEFSIQFDAAAVPFWEDAVPQRLTLSGESGTGSIVNLGNKAAEPEITVTPTGGALDALTLTLGDDTFAFADLDVAQGTALRLYHDERGYLRILAGNVSRLGCRSEASPDELRAQPGSNAFSYAADTACSVVVEVHGRWL